MLNDKTILITGGTGFFGQKCAEMIFERYRPKKVIIFSRDEFKQFEMAKKFSPNDYNIRYFLGDVRDRERLKRAFHGVDVVIHAAALKQVPALEYNPTEAVKTNVNGAENIVDAAIDAGVAQVVAVSTDKACNPANLYGATKLVAEKIFTAARDYAGGAVNFSVVRYGNVVGSRGSVIPFFLQLKENGVTEYPITDERMTRFWITVEQGVELVFTAIANSVGGEIFVPKIPSMKVVDLVEAIDEKSSIKVIGIRPGEKLHEMLLSDLEVRTAKDMDGHYVILPPLYEKAEIYSKYNGCDSVDTGFCYTSDLNDDWLSVDDLRELVFSKVTCK